MLLDEAIRQRCQAAVADQIFPGCTVGYIRDGESKILACGRQTYDDASPAVAADTIYDTASVTKSVVTGSVALKLIEDGRLELGHLVIDYVPELQNQYRGSITIWHLMTYTVVFDIQGGLSRLAQDNPQSVFAMMCQAPLLAPPGKRYFYTNPPAILLATVIERLTGESLEELAQRYFFKPLGMADSTLQPELLPRERIAPTEIDIRGEVHGVVHDEAAWAMASAGKLAGNAGLFSTAPDLLKFSQMLLDHGNGGGKKLLDPATVELMHTNQIAELGESTGLGWELHSPLVMGQRADGQAFGKTGFTGCIITIDPVQKKALVHLSNRTYPRRQANRDRINAFRRDLSDLVFTA